MNPVLNAITLGSYLVAAGLVALAGVLLILEERRGRKG